MKILKIVKGPAFSDVKIAAARFFLGEEWDLPEFVFQVEMKSDKPASVAEHTLKITDFGRPFGYRSAWRLRVDSHNKSFGSEHVEVFYYPEEKGHVEVS